MGQPGCEEVGMTDRKVFATRLNPPPANGWTPPPLDDFVPADQSRGITKERPKRGSNGAGSSSTETLQPKMLNLFEEAPKTLFDEEDGR